MTEYEYIESIILARDSLGFHLMNFIGVMFAYVIAAYFVAEKLTRFQLISVTFLYSLFTPGAVDTHINLQ